MLQDWKSVAAPSVTLEEEELVNVGQFNYLSSCMTKDGSTR